MNWIALVIISIWVSAGIATSITGEAGCMGAAMVTTICIGLGYCAMQ